MQLTTFTALFTLYMLQTCNSVKIDGASNDPDIVVDFTDDPRNINRIMPKLDYWKMYQAWDDPLYDWPLKMTLNARKFGFESGKKSTLEIEMRGFCEPGRSNGECDAFYAFSIGDQYITFVNDFDNGFNVNGTAGIFIYPACNTNLKVTGDASQLIPTQSSGKFTNNGMKGALAGGDNTNWYRLTETNNGPTFPVTFEFINDDIADTFTIRFTSDTFPRGLECVYHSARATGQDFKFYFTPDGGEETIKVRSFEISGENIGTDCEFCDCAASAHSMHGNGVKFLMNPENMNDLDDRPDIKTMMIWSGLTSMIISLMTVFISYIICIKPKTNTQIYDKVKE